MNRQMEFELIFRAQAAAAKNATNDLRNDVAALGNEVTKTAAAFDREAAAMNRDTEAARKNTDATNALTQAEQRAREDALRASGAVPASAPAANVRRPRRNPLREPQTPSTPPAPPSPPTPPTPPVPPSNDNVRRDRARRQNLTYQVFDIGQGVSGGMPLPMIAAQQLPQIIQLYTGQGGMNSALKDFRVLAGGAARVITPLTVGIAGLTAAVATGAIAYNGYLQSTKEVETAASGLGRAVAGSRTEMEAAAQAGASAAGISVSSARSMEAQFLRTGRIGSENFESLISISKDFGATMGITTAEAGSMLAEMFADPAKAADTLFQKYGLIDAATARHASNLAAQNRQSEAQAVLLKALPDQLANASEATTALGRAWEFVARNASNAFDNVGSFLDRRISGPTLEEQIAEAEAAQKRLTSGFGFLDLLNPAGTAANANAVRLEELREQKRRQDEAAAERKRVQEDAARSRAALAIAESSPANNSRQREQELRNQIGALRSGRSASGVDDFQRGQIDTAIEAKTRSLDALINRQQRSAELDRLDIQISNERNPLLRAELEARRTRLQLAEQEISAETITAEAARVRNRVIGETIAAASLQASDMKAEAETRQRLNSLVASGAITSADANRMLQEEVTLRPLIAAAAAAEGAEKERLNKTIADLKGGYAALAEEEKRASVMEYLRGQNDNLEQLRLEKALIGENEAVRGRAIAMLDAEQKIRSMGLSTSSREAGQIREVAQEQAKLTREIEKQAEAWDTVRSAAESAIDGGIDKLIDGDFGGALESVAKDITGMFSELAIKNPIKNAMLGTDNATTSDVGGLGGLISGLFGKKSSDPAALVSGAMGQSVGSMSVSAATVMINGSVVGGLGGASSGILGAANSNVTGSVTSSGTAVDLASSLVGSSETANRLDINSFLSKGGVDIDAAQTAWCAGFVNSALKQIGVDGSGSLTANSFMNWGSAVDPSKILRGDVLVQSRGLSANQSGGHVGFATGQSRMTGGQLQLEMLSGNYKNSVGTGWVNATDIQARRATEALGSLAGASGTATQGLGALGAGFDQFGKNLSGLFPAAPSAGGGGGGLSGFLGNLWGNLTNGAGTQWAGIASGAISGGLFSDGGWTGPGEAKDVAGVVHADEFVFSKKAVQKVGVGRLDAMHKGLLRGYETGGYTTGSVFPSAVGTNSNAPSSGRNAPIINNYGSSEVQYEEQADQHGNRQPVITIGRQMAAAIRQPGNPANRAIQGEFGVKRQAVRRW
ncbi:phage tail length tape measure family protein [Agrobacterium tumefaciens]|uniref:phage tail length tape measure family protein n=1 Tax=Agrobacterium tumefaciens TaxID=358 RepID=UPI0015728F1F|nr:phage tail length tape measure family protein [Agrobacterium tumefaciens]WCK69930.1 phage tail length tape measure family protein [Agrobacterium tumefaciens]